MKFVVVAAVFFVCLVDQIQGDDVEIAWMKYQAEFPLQSKSASESTKRKYNFVKTHNAIEKHNNNKNSTFKMEHNKFSVMDDDEKKEFISAAPPIKPPQKETRYLTMDDVHFTRALPTSVDYRTDVCMPAVKNQLKCGSCWAFAGTAVVEFGKCNKTGIKVNLSEQQMVDCTTKSYGCKGGWYDEACITLAVFGGQVNSTSYPYKAVQGKCMVSNTTAKAAAISKVTTVTYVAAKDTTTMMSLLASKRLFSVTFAIVNSFYGYKSGVYTEANCASKIIGYHCVTVVGYGSLNGINYWVLRNSWSSSWGASGYILFRRGTNLCEIENWAATTEIV